MTSSKMIAGLVGPTLVAMACGLLLNLGSISVLVESMARSPAIIFISGGLVFVAGLAILRVHNHWAADWSLLVTILGWLAVVGGLVRLLFPLRLAETAAGFAQSTGAIAVEAVVFLVLGVFLSVKGYSRRN